MKPTLAFLHRLLALTLLLCTASAWAEGTLTHMSGPVAVQRPDGKVHAAAVGEKVNEGDTVITGAGGFVRIEMTDSGEMVLRPDSHLKIETYKFVETKPAEDSFIFSVLKGGMRTVTGLIGKRGNKDAYELKTVTATMGIRGTQFDLRVCQGDCGALANGTYIAVRFGAVQTTNPQGSLAVAAGQVAYVPPQRPPVMLPRDPGIGFTPPAVIPKLDEKKKQAASAAAATTPDQPKAAASSSGQSGQSSTQKSGQATATSSDSSGKSDSSTKSETSSGKTDGSSSGAAAGGKDSGGGDTSGKSGGQTQSTGSSGAATRQSSSTATSQSTSSATTSALSTTSPMPAAQPAAGGDCSVQ